MSVERIMTSPVVTVELNNTLWVVKGVFERTHFHHLLVVESGRLIGVISDRDLLKAISHNIGTAAETTRDSLTLNKKVQHIATRKPITIKASEGIYHAVDIFLKHKISCIPVVDESDKPVGIVSWRDIMQEIRLIRDRQIQAIKSNQTNDVC